MYPFFINEKSIEILYFIEMIMLITNKVLNLSRAAHALRLIKLFIKTNNDRMLK